MSHMQHGRAEVLCVGLFLASLYGLYEVMSVGPRDRTGCRGSEMRAVERKLGCGAEFTPGRTATQGASTMACG